MSFKLPGLSSPTDGMVAPMNPLQQILQAVGQAPQIIQQAQDAQQQRKDANYAEGQKLLQQAHDVYKMNPAAANSPQLKAMVAKGAQLMGIPVPTMDVPQQAATPPLQNPAAAPVVNGNTQAPSPVLNAIPNQIAANQPGQPQNRIPNMAAANPTAPAQAAPGLATPPETYNPANDPNIKPQQQINYDALQAPRDPATFFTNTEFMKTFSEASPQFRRGLNETLKLRLPDAILDAPAPMTPGLQLVYAKQYQDQQAAVASGNLSPDQYMNWLSSSSSNLAQLGINVNQALNENPAVVGQISAQAQAKITELEDSGVLKHAQAQRMLQELPADLAKINSTTDLNNMRAKYYGVETAELPLKDQAQIKHWQVMGDAATRNAQTAVDRLGLLQKKFDAQGGPQDAKELASSRKILDAVGTAYHQADAAYRGMLQTGTRITSAVPPGTLSADFTNQLNQYKVARDNAKKAYDGYKDKFQSVYTPQAIGKTLPGTVSVSGGGIIPVLPGYTEEDMKETKAKFKAANAKTKQEALAMPGITPAVRQYLLAP